MVGNIWLQMKSFMCYTSFGNCYLPHRHFILPARRILIKCVSDLASKTATLNKEYIKKDPP